MAHLLLPALTLSASGAVQAWTGVLHFRTELQRIRASRDLPEDKSAVGVRSDIGCKRQRFERAMRIVQDQARRSPLQVGGERGREDSRV